MRKFAKCRPSRSHHACFTGFLYVALTIPRSWVFAFAVLPQAAQGEPGCRQLPQGQARMTVAETVAELTVRASWLNSPPGQIKKPSKRA